MNKLTIIGNLTRDPEHRDMNDGKSVCNFTVAVNRRRKIEGQPEADFFRVAAWGKLGENCQKFLTKGRKVAVIGQVSVRTYQDKDNVTRASLEVFAEDVEFLSSPNSGSSEQAPVIDPQSNMEQVETEELPF